MHMCLCGHTHMHVHAHTHKSALKVFPLTLSHAQPAFHFPTLKQLTSTSCFVFTSTLTTILNSLSPALDILIKILSNRGRCRKMALWEDMELASPHN